MKAILINKNDEGYRAELTEVEESQLPDGEVTVRVDYSTLNYKDSLAITGAAPVVRKFPMVPGIDFTGTVIESTSEEFAPGDRVVQNGWGAGEVHWGGLAQKARVKSDWLVGLPEKFSTRQGAAVGTAGYTAMLCILALERSGVTPGNGEILVTGAAGGVGSVAVSILAGLGYTVVASSGRPAEADYLKALGAAEIIDRAQLSEKGPPLGKERWAGAVDCVGSQTLVNVCATMKYGGTVAACGLAQGMDFPATVMPFILRGITLAGIDSVYCPKPLRTEAWRRIASDLDLGQLEQMTSEIGLSDVIDTASQQLAGQTRGRVVVNVNG